MEGKNRSSFLVFHMFVIYTLTSGIFCKNDMLGPVDVVVNFVGECENPEKYPIKIFLQRTKFNRSHDAFSMRAKTDFEIDDSIGMHIHVWKWGDGGYKPNYVIMDDDHACSFLMKWQEKEFKNVLRALGREESCQIGKGEFVLENYPFLMTPPQVMMYGNFKVDVTFRRENKVISCIQARAITKPKNVLG